MLCQTINTIIATIAEPHTIILDTYYNIYTNITLLITLYFLIFPNSELLPSTFKYSQRLSYTSKHFQIPPNTQTLPNASTFYTYVITYVDLYTYNIFTILQTCNTNNYYI